MRRYRRPALSAAALLLAGLVLPLTDPTATARAESAACDAWGCPDDEQPRLSTKVPAAAKAGAYASDDFDNDGARNRADNCLLVPNPGQEPAVRPAGETVDKLAAQWRRANPKAAFRTNAELGEACSGWNEHWHRTEEAQILAPDALKHQLYRYLATGGPMFGADTLVYGGPVCSDLNTGWIAMGEYAFGFPQQAMPAPECPSGTFVPEFTDLITAHLWGGKRLFTLTNAGGEITNRFFPSMSEHPLAQPFVAAAGEEWFPHGKPQTVLGHVIRGRSYVDGRSTIIMDWRAFTDGRNRGRDNNGPATGSNVGGYPLANAGMPGGTRFLVYDECRGLQEGIWTCNANADIVRANGDRRLFQFGWMMWQSLDPDIARWGAWERVNPQWTTAAAYGFQ